MTGFANPIVYMDFVKGTFYIQGKFYSNIFDLIAQMPGNLGDVVYAPGIGLQYGVLNPAGPITTSPIAINDFAAIMTTLFDGPGFIAYTSFVQQFLADSPETTWLGFSPGNIPNSNNYMQGSTTETPNHYDYVAQNGGGGACDTPFDANGAHIQAVQYQLGQSSNFSVDGSGVVNSGVPEAAPPFPFTTIDFNNINHGGSQWTGPNYILLFAIYAYNNVTSTLPNGTTQAPIAPTAAGKNSMSPPLPVPLPCIPCCATAAPICHCENNGAE